jgi:hypothetical protein
VAVENLAGEMHVLPSPEGAVVVKALVHAESDELASSVRIEVVPGDKGIPTLRVLYPVEKFRTFRYPAMQSEGHHSGGSVSEASYGGTRVSVSPDSGVLLWVDLEVWVPAGLQANFRNVAGPLSAQGLDGRLRFDTARGNIALEGMTGETSADTGSGRVSVHGGKGSLNVDTGSGECAIAGFEGESIKIDTGSGMVKVEASKARRIMADTGSGSVEFRGVDAEEIGGDTGSGSVHVEATGRRLRKVHVDSGTGSVVVRLDPDLGFHLKASVSTGSVHCDFTDVRTLRTDHDGVECQRGDGGVQINVETGAGSVTLAPLRP